MHHKFVMLTFQISLVTIRTINMNIQQLYVVLPLLCTTFRTATISPHRLGFIIGNGYVYCAVRTVYFYIIQLKTRLYRVKQIL
jgi:hypothetical protein